MYKTFVFSFDPAAADISQVRVTEFLRCHRSVYQIFSPFTGTVFIKSTGTREEFVVDLYKFLFPSLFTISQIVDPDDHAGGYVSEQFWNWVNSTSPPALTSS